MLREERKAGVTDVCLSSHYYAAENSISTFIDRRQHMYSRLCEEMKDRHFKNPRLHLGAEVYYFKGIADEPLLDLLCCGDSNLILIEPPMQKWDDELFRELRRLREERGLQPVIAHLDRYVMMLDDPELFAKVRSSGFLIQCNISFFLREDSSALACNLLRSGAVSFIGSDAHNMTNRAVKMDSFLRLIKKERLEERLYTLSENGLRILQGKNASNSGRRSFL